MYQSLITAHRAASASIDWTPIVDSIITLLGVILGWWLNELTTKRRAARGAFENAVTASTAALALMSRKELLTADLLDQSQGIDHSSDRLTTLQNGVSVELAQTALALLNARHPDRKVRDLAASLSTDLTWVKARTEGWYEQRLANCGAADEAAKERIGDLVREADDSRKRAQRHLDELAQGSKGPIVEQVWPGLGQIVIISGRYFKPSWWQRSRKAQIYDLEVWFGATKISKWWFYDSRTIGAVAPKGVGQVQVRVTLNKRSSATPGNRLVYPPPPVITQVSPDSVGTLLIRRIKVNGQNLARAASVHFGQKEARSVRYSSDGTLITARAPRNRRGQVTLVVTTISGSAKKQFTYR